MPTARDAPPRSGAVPHPGDPGAVPRPGGVVTGYRLFLTAPWEKLSPEESARWGARAGVAGGVDVYRPRAGSGVPAALVVGLGGEVRGAGWEAVEVAGGPAVRRAWAGRAPVDALRVAYAIEVPGGSGRRCLAVFSAPDTAEPLGATLVEWFDAAMGTFRWTYD